MKRSVVEFFKKTRFMSSEDTAKEAAKFHCTVCGAPFDEWDVQESLDLDYWMGYGSRYNGGHFQVSFCINCFDKFLDGLREKGKESPVVRIEDLDDEYGPEDINAFSEADVNEILGRDEVENESEEES